MKINRIIRLDNDIKPGKTLLLLGPRRVGKTTLMNDFLQTTKKKVAVYNGDNLSTQQMFSVPESSLLKAQVGSAEVLAIDEAQAIPNIGKSLKIINDTLAEISVIVTGSSSFELTGQIGEPLTGRKTTLYLFPISVSELLKDNVTPQRSFEQLLPQLLVYGMYPDAITAQSNEERALFLRELVNSYLLRDILAYREVKGSNLLLRLLALLAFQIGREVSLSELGVALDIDKKTVARYLDLLEKSYVVFRLSGFSRNLRSEVTKTAKYFFYDIGVRNAVINNFNDLDFRDDIGKLWENFAVVERLKHRTYNNVYSNQYFWRTWAQSEVDLIEERSGKLFGYEMRWNDKLAKPPKGWLDTYKEASWQVITPKNILAFVSAG